MLIFVSKSAKSLMAWTVGFCF